MQRSGFLIRFIDIGLIILFGFLAITDIETFSRIDMPGSKENLTQTEPQQMSFVTVQIEPGPVFSVSQWDTEQTACRVKRLQPLETCLVRVSRRYREQGKRAIVLLNPDEASIVQHTVDVLDICDRHGILKNINIESLKL